MTTETINIRIREDGSRVVVRNIDSIGQAAERSSHILDTLKTALGGMAAFLSIQAIKEYIDNWQRANSSIANATKTVKEHIAVQQQLFSIAQKTQTQFTSVVELYSRAARAGKELGASQQQIIRFTDGVGKSLAIAGVSSEQASGALQQLGQALGNGVIQAEEFNSIVDTAPIILQTVANNIKDAAGSIGNLKQMVNDGKVSSKEFFDAFLKGSGELDAQMANVRQTFGGAMVTFDNAMTKVLGQLNESVVLTTIFKTFISALTNSINFLISALIGVGVAVAIAFAPAAVLAFIAVVSKAWLILAANPFLALIGAIVAVISYIGLFGDEINAGVDEITTMADVTATTIEMMKEAWDSFSSFVSEIYTYLFMIGEDGNNNMLNGTQATTEGMTGLWGGFFDDTYNGWAGLLQGIARITDAIAGLLTGMAIAVYRFFAGICGSIVQDFNQVYNSVVTIIQNTINAGIGGLNKLRSMVGMGLLEAVAIQKKEVNEKAYKQYGESLANSFNDGFATQGGFMENKVKELVTRSQARAAKRTNDVDLTTPIGAPSKKLADDAAKKAGGAKDNSAEKAARQAARDLEKLKDAYESLVGKLDPLRKVQIDYNNDLETLNKALKAGLLTGAEYDNYVVKLKEHYEEALHPMKAVTDAISKELELAKMGSKQREVEHGVRQRLDDLKKSNVIATQQETEALRQQLTTLQQMTEYQSQLERIKQQSDELSGRNKLKDITALGAAKSSGEVSEGDSALMSNEMLKNMGLDTSMLKIGSDAQQASYTQYYEQLDLMRQNDLISEREHSALKMQVWAQEQAAKLQTASSFFGNLAQLQNTNSKKLARIGKAAAIAQTVINTYQSATSAYAAMAGIPYIGPALGVAAAAAAIAAGMANVSAIKNQNVAGYMNGGYTGDGALNAISGVVHAKEYVMDAVTTNRIGVDNLDALRRGQMTLQPATAPQYNGLMPQLNVTIINQGTSKEFEVEQLSETDVRIIARDEAQTVVRQQASSVVAKDIEDASSDVSKSMSNNIKAERRR